MNETKREAKSQAVEKENIPVGFDLAVGWRTNGY